MSDMSSYDELIKLKELMDMGIISEDEFNAKKAQIFGLNSSSTSEPMEVNTELFACPGCGKKVSKKASTCPGCGYPIVETITELTINEEKAKSEAEKELRRKSDEYVELQRETVFKVGTKSINISKNKVLISEMIIAFDSVMKDISDNVDEIDGSTAWNMTLSSDGWFDSVVELDLGYDDAYDDFSYLILERSLPNLYQKIADLVKLYFGKGNKLIADEIYDDVINEDSVQSEIAGTIENICEAIKDIAKEKYDRAVNAEIAIHDYSSRINSVYSSTFLGSIVGGIKADVFDSVGATWHFLKNKDEYINSHAGLSELMDYVHDYANNTFRQYLKKLFWELKERVLKRFVEKLSEDLVLSEDSKYDELSYESYYELIEGRWKIREENNVEKDVVEMINCALIERNCLDIGAYRDLMIFGEYSKEQLEAICKLIEYLNLKSEIIDELKNIDWGWGLDNRKVSFEIIELEEGKRIVESQKKWIQKKHDLIQNLETVWPDILLLNGFADGGKDETRLFLENQRILDRVELASSFVSRLSSFCEALKIPFEDVNPSCITVYKSQGSKEYKLWNDIEDAIYVKRHEIYGHSCEHVHWKKYDAYNKVWYVLTDYRFATNDFSIDLTSINEIRLLKSRMQGHAICPLEISLKDSQKVQIPSDCEYAKKINDTLIIDIDEGCIEPKTSSLFEVMSIALEFNADKQYIRKGHVGDNSCRETLCRMFPEYEITIDDFAGKIAKKDMNVIYEGEDCEKAQLFMKRFLAICKYADIEIEDKYVSENSNLYERCKKSHTYERVIFCAYDNFNHLYMLTDYRAIIQDIEFDLYDEILQIGIFNCNQLYSPTMLVMTTKDGFDKGKIPENNWYCGNQTISIGIPKEIISKIKNLESIIGAVNVAVEAFAEHQKYNSFTTQTYYCHKCGNIDTYKAISEQTMCKHCGQSFFGKYTHNRDRLFDYVYGYGNQKAKRIEWYEQIKDLEKSKYYVKEVTAKVKEEAVDVANEDTENSKSEKKTIPTADSTSHLSKETQNFIPIDRVACKNCGQLVLKSSKFCGFCGQSMLEKKYCLKCGKEINITAKFCNFCGEKF